MVRLEGDINQVRLSPEELVAAARKAIQDPDFQERLRQDQAIIDTVVKGLKEERLLDPNEIHQPMDC